MLTFPSLEHPLRVVLQLASGTMKICGLAPATVTELCKNASFVEAAVFGVPASLVAVYPRYILYRELTVPTGLKNFARNQL